MLNIITNTQALSRMILQDAQHTVMIQHGRAAFQWDHNPISDAVAIEQSKAAITGRLRKYNYEFSLRTRIIAGIKAALTQRHRANVWAGLQDSAIKASDFESLNDQDINNLVKREMQLMFVAASHILRGHGHKSYVISDDRNFLPGICDVINSRIPYDARRNYELPHDIFRQMLKKNVRETFSGAWGCIELLPDSKLRISSRLETLPQLEDLPTESKILKF